MLKRNKKGQFTKGSEPTHGFKKGVIVWNKNKKGIHLSPDSEFKKGMIPWNKGLKGVIKPNSGSFTKGEHRSIDTEFDSKRTKNENNHNWKGDKVGYFGLHTWIQRNMGKAKICTNRENQFLPFECSKKSNYYDWANRSRKYKRDKDDWLELCHSCHLKADRRKIEL